MKLVSKELDKKFQWWKKGFKGLIHCLFWFFTAQSTIFQLCRDGFSWVEPALSRDQCVLLKDTMQCCRWGLNPQPLNHESSILPLIHCALSHCNTILTIIRIYQECEGWIGKSVLYNAIRIKISYTSLYMLAGRPVTLLFVFVVVCREKKSSHEVAHMSSQTIFLV